MTQTDPFGNEPQGASATAPAVQFDVDTIKQASLGSKVALGGAVVAFVGTFLTWASVSIPSEFAGFGGETSTSGFSSGEGKLTVLAAIAVGVLTVMQLMKGWNKGMAIGAIAAPVVALLACLSAWSDISDAGGAVAGLGGVSVSTGIGLYLCIAACLAMIAGAGLDFKAHLAPKSDVPA